MNRRTSACLAFVILALAIRSAAAIQAPADPEMSLANLNKWFAAELKRYKDEKKPVDYPTLLKERLQRAKDAVKGQDPSTVEPAKGMALAQLYQEVSMTKEMVATAGRYAASTLDPDKKYAAQIMMLRGYQRLQDAAGVRDLLNSIKPPSPAASLGLLSETASALAPFLAQTYGPDAGLSVLAKMEATVPLDEMLHDEAVKARAQPAAPGGASRYSPTESLISSIAGSRAFMLEQAGRKSDAEYVLEQAAKRLNPAGRDARVLQNMLTSSRIIGTSAPVLAFDRKQGEFTNLSALRGKVVVLDYFAHWCGPCKQAHPAMKKLYADLHDKGLEIIGVTGYYGFFGTEKNLLPEAEFARMEEYKKQEGLPWPIVFGGKENTTTYGVDGFPAFILIDRQGKVSATSVGFNTETFAQFRGKIEKLLKEAN